MDRSSSSFTNDRLIGGDFEQALKASVIISGGVSAAFRGALTSTRSGLKAIGEEIVKVEKRQRLMAQSIGVFGKQGKSVDGLRRQYAELTREADKLRAAQERMAKSQDRIDANDRRRRALGSKLRDSTATFGVVAAATFAPIRSAVQFETAMLGVAKQLNGARDAAGNLTPTYYRMSKQVQRLGREIPIATTELADMVAAGLRMGVAEDQVISFTRTASMMADAFELPAGQLADDMGKIAGLFHIPIPRIGELADAINYLDDNAKSTGSGIIDVLRRTGGMAQALKMPAKEAAALGSIFLTLGSTAEVSGTATNALLRILGAATAQSKRVRVGLSSMGFDPAAIQASMAKDATGTIEKLLDKLNSLNDEQRMVASTRIFGAEYGDDIAKLATGADEYRRQLSLVRGEEQSGSMSREFSARLKTAGAQWQLTKNRISEMGTAIGDALLPAVDALSKSAAPMVEKFAEWTAANPGAVKGVIGTALALSGLRVVTTGVAYAFTAVQGPILSVMGFIARFRATSALASIGRFGPVAMRVAGVLRTVGTAIAAIGGGPITVAVAAITAGALVVRKYWEPIKAFMGGMFDGLRAAVGPALGEFKTAIAPLRPAWDSLSSAIGKAWDWVMRLLEPVNMTSEELAGAASAGQKFGSIIGAVMANGVRQIAFVVKAVALVGSGILTVAGYLTGNTVKAWEKVKSVAGSAIGFIMRMMQPLIGAMGMIGQGWNAMTGGGSVSLPSADGKVPARPVSPLALPPAQGRKAPQLSSPTTRGKVSVPAAQSSHVYHITQMPGESQEALARRIAAEHKREEATARRGSLVDRVA